MSRGPAVTKAGAVNMLSVAAEEKFLTTNAINVISTALSGRPSETIAVLNAIQFFDLPSARSPVLRSSN
jgi:hypothetical protein